MFSEVVKKIAVRKNRRDNLRDQDRVVDYITKTVEGEEANDWNDMECPFQFIITRPSGMVWDRPSRKKLAPSKSVRNSRVNKATNAYTCSSQHRNSHSHSSLLQLYHTVAWTIPNHEH